MKTRTLPLANYWLCAIVILIASCRKETDLPISTSITKSAGATFTLNSDGTNCTEEKLEGNYMSGIVMNAGNTAELQVIVTQKGPYMLTTDAVNGIRFSGSGTFQKTGYQTVVLFANGTPQAEGERKITIYGAGNSCGFNVVFLPKAPPAAFSFEGAPNACATPVIKGDYVKGKALTSSNRVIVKVNVTKAGSYSITTSDVDGISFSGSGVFSSTGTDIPVVLTGSGTALSSGKRYFRLGKDSGCGFNITFKDSPSVGYGNALSAN